MDKINFPTSKNPLDNIYLGKYMISVYEQYFLDLEEILGTQKLWLRDIFGMP